MNAYTARGQARTNSRDMATGVQANRHLAGTALTMFERQRGYQAEAEVAWLLKDNGVTPQAGASFLSLLRQTIGAALVRARDRVASVPRSGVSLETAPAGTQGGGQSW